MPNLDDRVFAVFTFGRKESAGRLQGCPAYPGGTRWRVRARPMVIIGVLANQGSVCL